MTNSAAMHVIKRVTKGIQNGVSYKRTTNTSYTIFGVLGFDFRTERSNNKLCSEARTSLLVYQLALTAGMPIGKPPSLVVH